MPSSKYKHDLIIANDDGTVLHIPHDDWNKAGYRVSQDRFEGNGWKLVRELLQCGVNLATVPPEPLLPPGTPEPEGTCYLVNIEGLKQSHKFLRKP